MTLVPFFASSTAFGCTKNLASLPFQAPVFFGLLLEYEHSSVSILKPVIDCFLNLSLTCMKSISIFKLWNKVAVNWQKTFGKFSSKDYITQTKKFSIPFLKIVTRPPIVFYTLSEKLTAIKVDAIISASSLDTCFSFYSILQIRVYRALYGLYKSFASKEDRINRYFPLGIRDIFEHLPTLQIFSL